ncbi:hypothetical protein [Prevotella ihumii]|uniref:hypothetical protein n=1 Tax=Prevotella ihumii TaxID=1917878 RepID=UPI001F440634|nr:hypothetical protein [Prevotella ihumii]
MAIMLFSVNSANAWGRVVYDKNAIAAVGANTAFQTLIENKHNTQLDSIRSKQGKIMSYTASMESIKELYRMSMQNIRGFGEESAYYRQMAEQFIQVPGNTARAVKAINRCPGINYVNSLNEIVNIQNEVVGLIEDFVDIVNNGKVDLSAFTSGKSNDKLSNLLKNAHIGKGDGYNFLDRYERLTLANKLLSHIVDINTRLQQIVYICEFCCTFSNLMYSIDPLTWASFFSGKNIVDDVVSDWNYHMNS